MAQSRLRSLGEGDTSEFFQPPHDPNLDPIPHPEYAQPHPTENFAANILLTSLKALSQRAVIAVANLFVLATAISAWWLWMVTMPTPSVLQLVGLGLYGVLILALNWLVLRRT